MRGFELTEQDQLPPEVVELIRNTVPQWRFEPVVIDGKPVVAKTDMNVRVVATQMPEDQFQIRLGGATFGQGAPNPNEIPRANRLRPPGYPRTAAYANATGTVYLILKIGRIGKVEDVVVEQVNLGVIGTEKDIAMLRDMFSKSAMEQARRWKFIPPTEGPEAGGEFWSVRVPVVYSMSGKRAPTYGKWEAYLPGPRHRIPWATKDEGLAFSPDALPDGSVHLAGSGLKLLSAPGG